MVYNYILLLIFSNSLTFVIGKDISVGSHEQLLKCTVSMNFNSWPVVKYYNNTNVVQTLSTICQCCEYENLMCTVVLENWQAYLEVNVHANPQQLTQMSCLGLGKLFPKIHLLFYSFIPKFSAYYSLKPAHYSYIILKRSQTSPLFLHYSQTCSQTL